MNGIAVSCLHSSPVISPNNWIKTPEGFHRSIFGVELEESIVSVES